MIGVVQAGEWATELPHSALDVMPIGILLADAAGVVFYCNPAFTITTGHRASEVLGRPCASLIASDTDAATSGRIRDCFTAGRPFAGTVRHQRRSGEPFWSDLTIAPVGEPGAVTQYVVLQRDATDRIDTQRLLHETVQQRATYRVLLDLARTLAQHTSIAALLQAVADAVPELCDADRASVAEWDPVAKRISMLALTGHHASMLEEARAFSVTAEESPELEQVITLHQPTLLNERNASSWAKALLKQFGVNTILTMPMPSAGELPGFLIASWAETAGPERIGPDLGARLSELSAIAAIALHNAHLLEQVQQAATSDPLTGLPNRTVFEQRLAEALQHRVAGTEVGVIFCDIDEFKRTNDSLGHPAGDRVLQQVAARLKAALEDGDIVARVGGDEFMVLLPEIHGRDEVDAVVRRLDRTLQEPLIVDGNHLRVRLSTGVAISDSGHASAEVAAEEIIRTADAGMYWRKGRRRPPTAADGVAPEQRIRADLADATDRDQIQAYYQPQLDLQTGVIVAVEALARWAHPDLGILAAEDFVPLAEATGDIAVLGRHILRTSCVLAAELRRHLPDLGMSVNVSAHELASPGFADHVMVELDAAGLPAGALTLELTETRLPSDEALLSAQASHLRRLGVHIALDDFGTGYTAISQLQTLPITELKIDRSFVRTDPETGVDLSAAIVGLAHGLHLQVVAEGVETSEQLAHLRSIGADRAQGFAISHPLPAHRLRRFLDMSMDRRPTFSG
ncbi:EAL domain-containing protein [Amnibacterium sp.]|uniref:sensor domain-containing protein n=1 Tax=Amnibacterium sp. TaxID=1872496 RepID=UPI0026073DE4|nr:EAL domain-containing protein [Amnibacterium sp.]MCU1472881.1 hypothetical protein [Amnibacterium sp.]